MEPVTLHNMPSSTGWIEVICGCMFSGKTEELIRRLRRAQIARQRVVIFKPKVDNRYSTSHIVSHSEQSLTSNVIDKPYEIMELGDRAQVIGIDEAQFFPLEIVEVCDRLANMGKRVIAAGLDQDYRGRPFGPIPNLLAVAEYITKTLAICMVCGNPADRTQRITKQQELVVVGARDVYEARCRKCFVPPVDGEMLKD
ncbi:MAG TPA: thymidine kinase [Bacteroidota bacterium]|nr:thymidine kinase [Bacteroidota bacterium]